MGEPTPPTPGNANIPLVQGVDPQWNSILQYVPEDKRSEVVPHISQYEQQYKPITEKYENWKSVVDSDLTPAQVEQAVTVLDALEHRPQEVYELLGKHLGVTPGQAQQMVENAGLNNNNPENEPDPNDPLSKIDLTQHPEFARLKHGHDLMAQVLLAEKQTQEQQRVQQEQDQALEKELSELKAKVGDFPEDEILMRMGYKELSAEEAFTEWQKSADQIRQRRPSPFVLGSQGGLIPKPPLDVKSLDSKGTKNLVAEMLAEAQRDQ